MGSPSFVGNTVVKNCAAANDDRADERDLAPATPGGERRQREDGRPGDGARHGTGQRPGRGRSARGQRRRKKTAT